MSAGPWRKYDAGRFKGSAISYASQGVCSICRRAPATWMRKRGVVWLAYCDACQDHALYFGGTKDNGRW